MNKTNALMVVLIIELCLIIPISKIESSNATTLIVPSDAYQTIQEAINAANPGDEIFIKEGIYHECVIVNKTVTLIGESVSGVIIEGIIEESCTVNLVINATGVVAANLTVRNAIEMEHYGILVSNTQNIELNTLIVEQNYRGLVFYNVNHSRVFNCTFRENSAYAITLLSKSQNNTFVGNNIMENPMGVYIENSCTDNQFYHNNFIRNVNQVDIINRGTNTKWNSTYPIGGNYWSDYTGVDNYSGPYQNETGPDGIGDTPHQTGGAKDYLPLMDVYGVLPPIAKFSYTPQQPTVNEKIVFNATESYDFGTYGQIASYKWDFGDGNTTTVTSASIEHAYTRYGTYTVTLTVMDNDGLKDETTKLLEITKKTAILTIFATPTTIDVGAEITLTGKLSPEKDGVNITLKYMSVYEDPFQFTTWKNLATVETNATGNYLYRWKPEKPAIYIVLANWQGDDETTNASDTTGQICVNKLTSVLTLNVEPTELTLGEKIAISGTLTPLRANTSVQIQMILVNRTDSWNMTIQTDSNGNYTYDWTPPEIGTYKIKTGWQGDEYAKPAESTVMTITVKQKTEPDDSRIYQYALVIVLIAVAIIVVVLKFKKK